MFVGNDTVLRWENQGDIYALQISYDNSAESPREWDNVATMACWHRRYSLGDKIEQKQPEEFWRKLVIENVSAGEIFASARDGKLDGIRLEECADEPGEFNIYETSYLAGFQTSKEAKEYLEYSEIPENAVADYLIDDLTIAHCQTLLEPYIEWMPLWLYDHSGITMSCGNRRGQFADRWDSGQVGWIALSKDRVMSEVGTEYVLDENGERIRVEHKHDNGCITWSYKTRPLTDDTWRKRAIEIMEAEVEVYDQYISGEVYGYELFKLVDGEWEEEDACWGFYGDDPEENGIVEQVGCGLAEALSEGRVEEGNAVTVASYHTEFSF